jgi:transaldolase
MKLFIDDGDTEAIAGLFKLGIFSGISTTPSIQKKSGRRSLEVVKEMLDRFTGVRFVQCTSS